jgi:ubiquinone/menaquinone biosynthesis C-methylase UbiE
MSDFVNLSYRNHAQSYEPGSRSEWMDLSTVDAWRHERMYASLLPLIERGERWLTVGDGRYGSDANFLGRQGADVLATDISDVHLPDAATKGFIQKYSIQNAERLTFADGSFDFALCKEAYHHFPRPAIALYEMLRVTRKGVCLIEPSDFYAGQSVVKSTFRSLIDLLKTALGRRPPRHMYEDTGNYMFSVSRREVEKVALGINLQAVAFKGTNDAYVDGAGGEKASTGGPLKKRIERTIAIKDALANAGLIDHTLLTAVILKSVPDDSLRKRLSDAGFDVVDLPVNPYVAP